MQPRKQTFIITVDLNFAKKKKWLNNVHMKTRKGYARNHRPIVQRTARQLACGFSKIWREIKDLLSKNSNTLTPDATHTRLSSRARLWKISSFFKRSSLYMPLDCVLVVARYILTHLKRHTQKGDEHTKMNFESFCKQNLRNPFLLKINTFWMHCAK